VLGRRPERSVVTKRKKDRRKEGKEDKFKEWRKGKREKDDGGSRQRKHKQLGLVSRQVVAVASSVNESTGFCSQWRESEAGFCKERQR
jgi:hypothetical protein